MNKKDAQYFCDIAEKRNEDVSSSLLLVLLNDIEKASRFGKFNLTFVLENECEQQVIKNLEQELKRLKFNVIVNNKTFNINWS